MLHMAGLPSILVGQHCDLFIYYFLGGGGRGFTARQDYVTHYEPTQSLGDAKTGDPRVKPPDHPQAEHGLSHL